MQIEGKSSLPLKITALAFEKGGLGASKKGSNSVTGTWLEQWVREKKEFSQRETWPVGEREGTKKNPGIYIH